MTVRWTVRLAAAAEQDVTDILRWTARNFGRAQAKTYAKTLAGAVRDLGEGPTAAGCRPRADIGVGIHTLHVARKGCQGRHFVVFRADADKHVIDVLRLLHDSMDLRYHMMEGN